MSALRGKADIAKTAENVCLSAVILPASTVIALRLLGDVAAALPRSRQGTDWILCSYQDCSRTS